MESPPASPGREREWDSKLVRYIPEGRRLASIKRVYVPRDSQSQSQPLPTPTKSERTYSPQSPGRDGGTLRNSRDLMSRIDRYVASSNRSTTSPAPSPSLPSQEFVDQLESLPYEPLDRHGKDEMIDAWRATVLDVDRVPLRSSRHYDDSPRLRRSAMMRPRHNDPPTAENSEPMSSALHSRRYPAHRQVSFEAVAEEIGRPSGVKKSGTTTLFEEGNRDILGHKNYQLLARQRLERVGQTSSRPRA